MSNDNVFEDAFNLLCGDKIGEGVHREVFECKLRPDLVVKVENQDMRHFANVMEMSFWDANESYTKISNWLAPCEFLSPDGRVLLQKRCEPVPKHYKFPEKIPGFLTDTKIKNFGMLDGVFVCIDYAITISNPSTRYVKVDFW